MQRLWCWEPSQINVFLGSVTNKVKDGESYYPFNGSYKSIQNKMIRVVLTTCNNDKLSWGSVVNQQMSTYLT